MVGWLREARRPWRVVPPSLTVSVLVLGACGQAAPVPGASGGSSGVGGDPGPTGSGGKGSISGIPPITGSASGGGACEALRTETPLFAEQAFDMRAPFARELYSWTTPEQIAEIREQGRLLTRDGRTGLGPGYAVERLAEYATVEGPVGELAKVLTGEDFALVRYAWLHPWATRMGWPGETYGGELLRIVLREEAWIAIFAQGTLTVVDANQATIPLDRALQEPQRIAGFFFLKDSSAGGPFCGSFSGGGNIYREFVIGNEAMIEEYSFGTETILARLQSDIALLEQFFQRIRPCPELLGPTDWNLRIGCSSWPGFGLQDEKAAYEAALAMPSPAYLPAGAPLATLIDTLKGDLFTPEPFVVRPGE
jgi:hypothetical protein